MPRNFERRVEVMFPVEADDLRRRIVEEIIPAYLSDNRRMRMLRPDGTYVRVTSDNAMPHRSQAELLALAASRGSSAATVDALPSFDAIAEGASGNGAAFREKRKKKKSSVK
jgi:polyphosphate kinase